MDYPTMLDEIIGAGQVDPDECEHNSIIECESEDFYQAGGGVDSRVTRWTECEKCHEVIEGYYDDEEAE